MSKFPLVENPIIVSGLVPNWSEIIALKMMPEYYIDSFLNDCRISEDYKVKKANEKLINLLFLENRKLRLKICEVKLANFWIISLNKYLLNH